MMGARKEDRGDEDGWVSGGGWVGCRGRGKGERG